MPAIRVSADGATLTLNGRVMQDLQEGDSIELDPANPHSAQINGVRPDSVTITSRNDRNVHDLTIRIQKFSEDDTFLNSIRNQEFPEVIEGSLKESFIRDGNDGEESWILEQGSMTDQPTETKNTQDGNAVMQYVIRFRNARRRL